MKQKLFWLFITLSLPAWVLAQRHAVPVSHEIDIIPRPLNIQQHNGYFLLTHATKICVDSGNRELLNIATSLSRGIKNLTGDIVSLTHLSNSQFRNDIVLTLKKAPDTLGKEGYALSVAQHQVIIRATEPRGLFYGMQSLLQMIRLQYPNSARIPEVNITDKPRFPWRGLMLDVGRYFYSIDFLKKYIDEMAVHKLNTFHLHLTEDHGWRIEIKKYPALTRVGAWRTGTQFDHDARSIDQNPHGGYYTQDEIKDLVGYAKARYIEIVPEIEMPGHSLAALVAYPELSCTGGPFKMPVAWGIQKDVYCAGNEKTYQFLEDVLSEIAALFPSPVIHIGGDECPKDRWKACPKCQAKIKTEGLKDEHELQSYFIKRIEKFLLTKNKRIMGWDGILEGGLAPNAAVMSWRGIDGGIAAAKQHHEVVMTPAAFTYFDFYQGEPYLEPVAIGGLLTAEKVYAYEPVPAELSIEEARYIRGVQGNVWSEYIHSPEKAEYMTFPRAAALAEVAWTRPELKNWDDFKRRLEVQYRQYQAAGINYSKSTYNVWHYTSVDTLTNTASVKLITQSYKPDIRYTTDGTEPDVRSQKYTQPLRLSLPVTVKAATFNKGKMTSSISTASILSVK